MGKKAKQLTSVELKKLKIKSRLKKRKKPNPLASRTRFLARITKAPRGKKQLDTRKHAPMSLPEIEVQKILSENDIPFEREFEINGKFYDFHLPHKILIEVDGVYWHSRDAVKLNHRQLRQRVEDRFKNVLARAKGFTLIRIWEDEVCESHVLKVIKEAMERTGHPQ